MLFRLEYFAIKRDFITFVTFILPSHFILMKILVTGASGFIGSFIVKEAIDRGVDMMDCVMPTRNGRNGMLFTRHGIMNMRNKKWADDFSPIQEDGPSYVDRAYSKAYLRHLFVSQEILALQIASIHNLAFYLWLVQEARKHIIAGDFKPWKEEMVVNVTRRL